MYVEVHVELLDHPKVLRVARLLNVSFLEALGATTALWLWSQRHATDGDLSRFEPDEIAFAIRWTGDPSALFDALTRAGLIDQPATGTALGSLHNWHLYGGKLHAARMRDAERKRAERAANQDNPPAQTGRPRDAGRTSAPRPSDVRRTLKKEKELDKDLTKSTTTSSSAPTDPAPDKPAWKPRNDHERLIEWWAHHSGVGMPTVFGRAASAAKKLTDAGLTIDTAPDLYAFCSEFMDGVTLDKMLSQFDAWKLARRKPTARAPTRSRRNIGLSTDELVAMATEGES